MCYDAFRNVEGTSPRQIIYGYLAAVIFLLACEKFVESEDFDTGIEVLTLVFVTIYGVLLYLYRTRKDELTRQVLGILVLACVVAELSINTFNTSLGTTGRSAYLGDQEDLENLSELMDEIGKEQDAFLDYAAADDRSEDEIVSYSTRHLEELYQEFMQDITEEIERENKIINDLLSLVKMDKTEGSMDISAVDINELLETTLKRLRPIARKRDIEVVLESLRPVTAEVDEVKISQIFTNLVENAIKYNHTDGKVTVSAERKRKEVVLTIADTGNGIDETFRERIFEPFFRVDKSRSRKIGGVGLGLAMVREIVRVHDGEIEVHGNEQGGTTFEVKMSIERLTIKSQV